MKRSPHMKGFPLITRILALCKETPRSIAQLAAELNIGYTSIMRMVNELKASGIIARLASAWPRTRGGAAALYGFIGGEVRTIGRRLTYQFLRLWNSLLDADAAASIAADIGLSENHVRKTIHAMRLSHPKLVRIADWQRADLAGGPTALYEVGDRRDAPRPKALTEQEYNRRANLRRKEKKLFDALSWRMAA